MKKHLFLTFIVLCVCSLKSLADEKTVVLSTGAELSIFQASADKANGRAVILCPGGGYAYRADASEGTDWANFFNDLGYTIAVLKYRLPKTKHEVPLTDGRAALAYLRANASTYMLIPQHIGVMGFSAGGHLASTIATHTEGEERPAFQILFYPVITMEAGKTHQGSIDQLLGTNPSDELVELYSNQKHVDAAAPPAYITYSENDGTVPPATNGKVYYDALVAAGVNVTLKTFPTGGHGWGLGAKLGSTYQAQMQSHFTAWLNQLDQLLPPTETFPELTTYTVESDVAAVSSFNPLVYPNVQTVSILSSAVATKNYTQNKNLSHIFGSSIKEYEFGEGITKLGNYILTNASSVERVKLPASLQTIGNLSFSKCAALTAIDLPDGLTDINVSAFSYAGLTTLKVPAVNNIKSLAFSQCTQLTTVEFAEGVDSIYGNVFKGCSALESIKCYGTVPPRAAATFVEAAQKAKVTLYVPAGSKEAYLAKDAWNGFAAVEEFVPTAVETVKSAAPVTGRAYLLDGRPAAKSQRGIVIVDGRKVVR